MKNKLLQILALSGAIMSGCSALTPKAEFGLSYVPERVNGRSYLNELVTDVSIGLEIPVYNFLFDFGGNLRTFVEPGFPFMKKVNWQEYGIYADLSFELNKSLKLTLFANHTCSHLLGEAPYWRQEILFGDEVITKIGIKLEAKWK